jgi:hypothetical protein
MKRLSTSKVAILAFAMMLSAAAQAATTVFTLGPPYVNYIPVLTQDGVPTSGLWYQDYVYDCALNANCQQYGQLPQASIEIVLPNDPTNPGATLYLYDCVGTVVVNTKPWVSKTQLPSGIVQSTEVCSNGSGGPTWTGTITYNYQSIGRRSCNGRACGFLYYPVLVSGEGTLNDGS